MSKFDVERLRQSNTMTFAGLAVAISELVEDAADEIERLAAMVAPLPKCWRLVDGKLIQDVLLMPGVRVYFRGMATPSEIRSEVIDRLTWTWKGMWLEWQDSPPNPGREPHDCYSTREAAEAAIEQDETELIEKARDA